MSLAVAEMALVSPLGLTPSEHVFFHRAEVTPHVTGAFTTTDGEALPIHDCPWIPASRPHGSRIRLLAKQALARVTPTSQKTPIILIAPRAEADVQAELTRFLSLGGATVAKTFTGSASLAIAFQEAQALLKREPEVVVLAVDSLLSKAAITDWFERRYSAFTRNPLPPSEGAAALRLVASSRPPLVGKIHAFASGRSEATDENDLPTDGAALTRAFAEVGLPARVPIVVGPRDVDPLRIRDFALASARHASKLDRAEMPSFEGRMGIFGSASGLMSTVFALAWLQHRLPLPDPVERRVGLAWARSIDGHVAAVLVGDAQS